MAQSSNVTPGHKPVKTSIPSDRGSAIGGVIRTTSGALNRGEARGPGAGAMGPGRPRPLGGPSGKK